MTVPVISAVGHETDFTISDFVSDVRAPTPSAAAELAVPDTLDMLNKFDNVNKRLKLILKKQVDIASSQYERIKSSRIFTDADIMFENRFLFLDHNTEKLYKQLDICISKNEGMFEKITSKLDALSPLKVMSRGYLFARDENNKIIKSINDIDADDVIKLKMCDGSAECSVNKIIKEN